MKRAFHHTEFATHTICVSLKRKSGVRGPQRARRPARAMKRLDMSGVAVVYAGEDWPHDQPPCSREMMGHLERNERLVSWLQPLQGSVQDQIPAIRVRSGFYTISLRMMKAIWRHVRLRKGFENVERAPHGGFKLKIPSMLLAEKLRTQSRFNVRGRCAGGFRRLFNVSQVMRTMASPSVKERKTSQSASSKIDSIVRQLFLPMLCMPAPPQTSFLPEDADDAILRQVAQERPGALASEADFVEYMVGLYRKFSEPLRVAEEAPLHAEQAGIGVPDALLDGREAVLVLGAD